MFSLSDSCEDMDSFTGKSYMVSHKLRNQNPAECTHGSSRQCLLIYGYWSMSAGAPNDYWRPKPLLVPQVSAGAPNDYWRPKPLLASQVLLVLQMIIGAPRSPHP